MENKENGEQFAVIRKEWAPVVKVSELAGALSENFDILFADALLIAGTAKGVIWRNASKEKAEEMAGRLQDIGISSFIIPEKNLIKIPRAINVTDIKCLVDKISFCIPPNNKAYDSPWSEIIAISSGYVRQVSIKTDPYVNQNFMGILGTHIPYLPLTRAIAFPMAIYKWFSDTKPVSTVKQFLLMDIITTNPVARFRVDSRHFAYTGLEEKMKPDTFNNFKELLRQILSHVPTTCMKRDIEMFLDEKNISEKATFRNPEEFDRYNGWLVQKAVYYQAEQKENGKQA